MRVLVVLSFFLARFKHISGSFITHTSRSFYPKLTNLSLFNAQVDTLVATKDGPPYSPSSGEEEKPFHSSSKFTFRKMEEKDISDLVRMYVREYSPSLALLQQQQIQFTLFPRKLIVNSKNENIEQIANFVDNFVLAAIIYLGLYQRCRRRWISEPDHQVWCLTTENDPTSEDNGIVVGAVELSLEISGQTSSPFCVPLEIKKNLLGNNNNRCLQPYVSNVIVKEDCRGKGYGSIMLRKIENEATKLGYDRLTLHVNTNSQTARSLYDKLGYNMIDSQTGNGLVGHIVRFLAGLYFIEESELLYMKKELNI